MCPYIKDGYHVQLDGRVVCVAAFGAEDCGNDNKHENTLRGEKKRIHDQYVNMQTIIQFFVNILIKWLIKVYISLLFPFTCNCARSDPSA